MKLPSSSPTLTPISSPISSEFALFPPIVAPDLPLSHAIALMNQNTLTCNLDPTVSVEIEKANCCVLIVENEELIGILTERDIVGQVAGQNPLDNSTVREVMTANPITLTRSQLTDIFSVLNLFRQHSIRHLPLLDDNGEILGVITPETLRQHLQPADLLRMREIGEVMQHQMITASPDTSLLTLARLLYEKAASCVVIVAENNPNSWHPLGIITERDIVQFQALELNFSQIQAQQVMSSPVFSLPPDSTLWEAHQAMKQRRIRRLGVTDAQNHLLGLVTQSSILQALDPMEMYKAIALLQNQVQALEAEKVELLQSQNTKLEAQVKQRTLQLTQQAKGDRLLTQIAQRIQISLDLVEVLNPTVTEIQQYFQVDRVVVYQFQPDWEGIVIAEARSPETLSLLGCTIYDPCFAPNWIEPYRNRRISTIADVETASLTDCHRQLLQNHQIRAHIVVPILKGTQLWGLLCVQECHHPRIWQSHEWELLEQIATHMGIAIDKSQLYRQVNRELRDRTTAETALKQLNEELETRVAVRTAELQAEIAERQQAQETLQKHLSAIEAAIDGIAILEGDRYVYVNDSHVKLFGYDSAEELIGQSWQILYSEAELARLSAEVFPILTAQGHWQGEATATRTDGSTFIEDLSLTFTREGALICVCRDITEQKQLEAQRQQAEIALQESETKFRQIAENIEQVFWMTDLERQQRFYISPAYEKIWGRSCESVYKRPQDFINAIEPEDRDRFLAALAQKEQGFDIEYRIRRPDGTLKWIRDRAFPLKNARGQVYRVTGIAEDISDRKLAEIALQESETKFRQIAENIEQVFWMTDTQTQQMFYISPAYEKIWGRTCESLYKRPQDFIDAIEPEDRDRFLAAMAQKEQGFDIEYRIRRPDGTLRWISDRAFPLRNTQGQVYRITGIAEDISDRKLAEIALQESQEFLRNVIDTNPNIIFVKDTQGRFTLANQALADLMNTTVAAVMGKTVAEIDLRPEEAAQHSQNDAQALKNGLTVVEETATTPDGETRYFQTIKTPLLTRDGSYQILGVATDITARKRAEQEMHKALQREKELSNLKSRFVSMTSHEFRTPLAVISSSAAILQRFAHKLKEEQKQQHLDTIQTYIKHTTQLLDDILLINKAEAGKLVYKPEPIEIVGFCDKLVSELQLSAPQHRLIHRIEAQTDLILHCDRKLLRQILMNLLSNAIKYSPENSEIVFYLCQTETSVIFKIQDAGIGIPPEDIKHLFESFHRATNVGNLPGTGLGLSIVKKCVELHNGQIAVESQVGEGTTFSVTLPC